MPVPFPAPRPGRVILLNGTSSSGKSAIAAELIELLPPPPWFHLPVDAINGMRAKGRSRQLPADELPRVLARTRAGFHRAVAGLAWAGNSVVADCVLSEPWRLADCLTVLGGLDVIFAAVRCDPAELRRRELARGDREPGQAETQLGAVHQPGRYDIECDTSATSALDCARAIAAFAVRPPPPGGRAFDQLRAAQSRPGQLRAEMR